MSDSGWNFQEMTVKNFLGLSEEESQEVEDRVNEDQENLTCPCCNIEMEETGGNTCTKPVGDRGWQCPQCLMIKLRGSDYLLDD